MNEDIVIDTNVLVHANNDNYEKQDDCIAFITKLMNSHELICLDENGFFWDIEYNKHVLNTPGTLGYIFLLTISNPLNSRIKIVERKIPPAINRKINVLGIKQSDRIFVRITYNSSNKILVSQEYEDFTIRNRAYFRDEIGVNIIEAKDY